MLKLCNVHVDRNLHVLRGSWIPISVYPRLVDLGNVRGELECNHVGTILIHNSVVYSILL